ncbi:hypothetical protein J4470_00745 [Candidatus Woesearchaeota archaeon]|nr:hypothetical protein [Candidatus Woesearchaeota archaeon]
MKRFTEPIKRIYLEDATYRNFLRKEYERRLLAHHKKTEKEAAKEAKAAKELCAGGFAVVARHKRIAFALLAVAIIGSVFYTAAVAKSLAVMALVLIASFSTVYKRKLGMPLGGIELVTFGTVLAAVAFNPVTGLLFGVVSSLASEIISQNIGPLTLVYVLITGLLGFLAGYLSYLNIVFIGVAFTVASLLLNQVIYLFIGDADVKSMTAFYIATNLSFNIILFATLGSRVLLLLTY